MRSQRRLVSPLEAIPEGIFTNKWSMDENSGTTLVDSIGGINMSYPFDLATSSVVGQVGNAIKFDLQSRNAQTAVDTSLSWIQNIGGLNKAIPFTVMFWLNDSGGSFNPIMSYGSGGFYHFYLSKNQNLANILFSYNSNGIDEIIGGRLGGLGIYNSNNHFALVFDPYNTKNQNIIEYYINGVIEGSFNAVIPSDGSLRLESHYFTAGGFGYTGSRTSIFTGWQDEIRFAMGSILKPEQILAIYNSEK